MMYGIVTLLDLPVNAQVETIWQELEMECGLVGIKITPLPHFSWQISNNYESDRTLEILERVAQTSPPFQVLASGLGIFTGQTPVIYIPVVKDENLLRLHARLWEETRQMVAGASSYYSPHRWMPHITLASGDVDVAKLNCAMRRLAFKSLELEISVDNLAMVYQVDDEEGWLKYRVDFRGG
jgi:2'-5' RNA ligase